MSASSARTLYPGVALITGAASGIGRGVAHSFAREGCTRIVIADRSEESLMETRNMILWACPEADIVCQATDVSVPGDVQSLLDLTIKTFGRLDYAVNAAGVLGASNRSHEMSIEEFDNVLNVDYRGCWLCSREELKHMVKQEPLQSHDGRPGSRGAIVNIASQLGIVARPTAPAYCSAKAAIIGLTKSDAIDYSKDNIRINCVCPGVIETPMVTAVMDYLKPAIAIAPMNRCGTVDEVADCFGPICIGLNQKAVAGSISEDCLFLNVFTPSNATSTSKLPVWFFIQGGGFNTNANSNYNGTEVVTKSGMNVIFVNMNYRVGGFGFLASEKVRADGDLNAGLLDQRKALMWVKKYIAQFGGDPDHVVIHGESAGAGSVGIHLTAYGGRNDDLFVGAVAQSPFFPTQSNVSNLEWQFDRFATAAGCTNDSKAMTCLRSLDTVALQPANVGSAYPGHSKAPLFYFTPAIDGVMIQDYPVRLFQAGNHVQVPLMVGDETNEGSAFAVNASTQGDISSFFTTNYPRLTAANTADINNLYPLMAPLPRHAAYFPSASAAYGESTFICPGLLMSQSLSSGQTQNVWNYRFNVTSVGTLAGGLGTPHTFDTAAILGVDFQGPPTSPTGVSFETYNAEIVPILMDYYISFIRTLSPNTLENEAAPVWLPFLETGTQQRLLLEINHTRMEDVPQAQQDRCKFWRTLASVTGQ
ncbi:hypothetical protein MBLNU459_g7721t1 [Dothideomycetes sp. NU459]